MNLRQHRRPNTAYLVLGTVALNILSLALPVMTLQVYDRILPNPDSGTLPILMAGVLVAILLETALRLARAAMMGWNGAVFEHQLSSRAMEHMLQADTARMERTGVGAFLHRMGAIVRLKDFESGYVAVTLLETAFIPLFIALIFYIAKPLAAIPACLLLVFVFISAIQGKRLQRELARRDHVDDKRYDFMIECLKGIHTVKAFALENLLSRRYEALQEKSGLASFRAAEASAASFNTGTMLSHVMMAAIMSVGAVYALSGHITTGALIATLQLSGRLMQPAQRTLALWARYQDAVLSRRKIDTIFSTPRHTQQTKTEYPAVSGQLSISNLNFRDLLKDINLTVAPGETISISGAVGAGKTSLMEIIAGLYPPDSGKVSIDGMDVTDYAPAELARHVGYMESGGDIFRGSIRDNITRFGTVNETAAQEIARLLHVDRDVARLPSGFDTPLQPDGIGAVPPGLRQRIALCRVLTLKPKIILFDEADRGLDREGYNLVFSLLGKLSRRTAMIIVSDDANLTALAQRHYTLENGTLTEKIAPQQLHQSPTDERKIAL